MEILEVAPGLHMVRHAFGQSYLWSTGTSVSLIDTGPPGSGENIEEALDILGFSLGDVDQVVLTHFHDDHVGSAAEISEWGEVTVVAGRDDADIIRGLVQGPPPSFTDEERVLHASIASGLSKAPPCRVDVEVGEGSVLSLGSDVIVVATPGHTDGSIALWSPDTGVLFTGDTMAHHEGRVIPGPFNLDPDEALASFRRLAAIDARVLCFGHGDPVLSGTGPGA